MSDFTTFERLALPLVRWLVALWVRPSVLPDDVKSRLGQGRVPVYALEKRSVIDLAVLEYVCRERGLPDPHAPVGAARVLSSSLLFLERRTGFFGSRIDRRHARGAARTDHGGGRRHHLRSGTCAGQPVLGPGARSRRQLVPPAGGRGLGHRRPLPQAAVAAAQRPQPAAAVRRADGAAARAVRDARHGPRTAAALAPAADAVPQPARGDHRAGPVAPPHDRDRSAAHPGGARRRARRHAGQEAGAPRRPEGRSRLRLRDRRQLLACVRRVRLGRAGPAVEPALRRRRAGELLQPAVGGGGQRSRLRAVPSQPHGLPAAVVRGLSQGLRRAAHRGRHQPEPAGDRFAAAPWRGVLPAAQLRRQRDVFSGVLALPRHHDGARPLDRVLHRGRAQPHGAAAAAEDRHAGDDRARVRAAGRCGPSCSCRSTSATSAWSRGGPTSASCPASPRKRNRSSGCCAPCPSCAAASARCTSVSASRCRLPTCWRGTSRNGTGRCP